MSASKQSLEIQKSTFNDEKNQYPEKYIINPPLHTQYEIAALLQVIPKNAKKIVDFGAGSGRITIPLLQKNFPVIAVDVSDDSLKKLQQLAKRLKVTELRTASTLREKDLDSIIGADILHHIAIHDYLPTFYSHLKIGGKIVFSEPGAFNLFWYIYLSLFFSWQAEKGMMQCTYGNLMSELKHAGYKNIQIVGMGLIPLPLFNWSSWLCRMNIRAGNLPLLKYFAYRYIIQAEK